MIPKTLISYSWNNESHKRWVMDFAARLREKGGVDVTLDRWNLTAGMDKFHFMEKSVEQSDRVLLIGTPEFAEKSSARKGGVGWEASIITAELGEDLSQTKFIPVLRRGTFSSSFPSWLRNRIGFDLSSDPYSEVEYERLVRELHQESIQAPPIGPRPVFADVLASDTLVLSPFVPAVPQDGPGRFRAKGNPLGEKWDQHPFTRASHEVTLADGPVMWLRVMPMQAPSKRWSAVELKTAGTRSGSWLIPFFDPTPWSLRADDGYGMYGSFDNPDYKEAYGVAFAFETGEVWSTDTYLLSDKHEIPLGALIEELVTKLPNYGGFLSQLGIPGPYRWAAGLDGIKGMHLVRHDAHPYSRKPKCLANQVSDAGEFSLGVDPNAVFYPLLRTLYSKCGLYPPAGIPQVGVQLPLRQSRRQDAIAYAYFVKKETNESISFYVRPTEAHDVYCIESTMGEEITGAKGDIADQFAQKRKSLVRDGYTEMNHANYSGDNQFG